MVDILTLIKLPQLQDNQEHFPIIQKSPLKYLEFHIGMKKLFETMEKENVRKRQNFLNSMLCSHVGDRSEFGIVSKIDDNGLLNINCYNEDNEYDTIYCNSVGPIISKNPFVHIVSLDDAFRGKIIAVDENNKL